MEKNVIIPEEILKKLVTLSERKTIPIEDLKKEYLEFFNSDFVQKDKSFTEDTDRHHYTMAVLNTKHGLRPPQKPYEIIPIGVDCIRKMKDGTAYTSLFALEYPDLKLRRISIKGENCEQINNISFFCLYKGVQLGKFKEGEDLIADDRSKFGQPIHIDKTPKELIEYLSFPETTIVDGRNNLNERGSDGFVNKTDWRCIRGIIQHYNMSNPGAEKEWGHYKIIDNSVEIDTVTPEGEVQKGFSVWISPLLMGYEKYSECLFLGNLIERKPKEEQLRKNPDLKSEVSMNCYCIIPIHEVPSEE